jgi:alanine dehydrogenase
MRVLLVSQAEVGRLLPMSACIEAVANALAALSRGEAVLPLRQAVRLPDGRGLLACMPAHAGHLGAVGVKAITVFPGNHGSELDAHQGAVLLFEAGRGRLLAVIDATSVTAIRTAAASAVATRLLAREDAGDLAILGTGVQARTHLEAMALVRPLRRVRVFSRDPQRARAFAEESARRQALPVEASASAREAVLGADLVCTVTSSREPVLLGEWIAAGAHVNAVGASIPSARELDTAAVASARLFVDRRESALNEAGDVLIPIREGAIGEGHIVAEVGDVLVGKAAGRESSREITLFKSLGLAIEDIASAHVIYANAEAARAGTWFELGGAREP